MFKSFFLAVAILFGVIYFRAPAPESLLDGTYDRILEPDTKEYLYVLLALGYTNEFALRMIHSTVRVTAQQNTDKSFTINTITPQGTHTVNIIPGKEFQDKLPDGRSFKATYVVEGNNLVVRRKIGDVEETIEKEISREGVKEKVTVKDKTATFSWKRISPVK